jgi:RNA polymerase-binding transcription factor DksA
LLQDAAAWEGEGAAPATRQKGFDMTKLTTAQVRVLERELLDHRRTLLASAREELTHGETESFTAIAGDVHDEADEALAAELIDFDNEVARRHGVALHDVNAALLRIRDREFGRCLDCDDEIAYARLKAFPTAVRCVRCQAQHERTFAHAATPTL